MIIIIIITFGLRHRWTYFLRALPDIANLQEPLERAISRCFDCSPFGAAGRQNRGHAACAHRCPWSSKSRQPVPTGIRGVHQATGPLVKQIAKQAVVPPNDEDVTGAQRCARQEKADSVRRDLEYVTKSLPLKTQRAVEFIKAKGASSWLSVIP